MKKEKKNYCQKWKRGNAIHKIEEYYENEMRIKSNNMFDKIKINLF